MKKKLKINGKDFSIKSDTLLKMLNEIDINFNNIKIAIAVNEKVIQKLYWENYKIKSGDIIEIVHPLKGG